MATSRAKKSSGLQPIVGNDGRLYFNYGVGAVYALYGTAEEEIGKVTISACDYSERRGELYAVETLGGKKNIFTERPVTLERLSAHFSFCRAQEVMPGKAEEIPLLKSEVTAYYKGALPPPLFLPFRFPQTRDRFPPALCAPPRSGASGRFTFVTKERRERSCPRRTSCRKAGRIACPTVLKDMPMPASGGVTP